MKKSITQKYPAKAESILSSCFVIKPATNNKLEYCEAKDVLWDTGATNTIISRNIADALGLEPIQKAMIAGIGGNVEAYTYKISLYFAKEGAWIKDLEVLACDLKDKKIQVHTIDYKDIDKFFPARSEITMSPLPKGHIARLATIHKVKAQ